MMPTTWTQADMDSALEEIRTMSMSITRACTTFRIPFTILCRRALLLGMKISRKSGPFCQRSMDKALDALRTGEISGTKAACTYGVPSSVLFRKARLEGIRLQKPFSARSKNWSKAELDQALEALRSGSITIEQASRQFNIPSGICEIEMHF